MNATMRFIVWGTIPLGMAVGGLVLFVAMLDELIQVARGKDPAAAPADAEPAHIE